MKVPLSTKIQAILFVALFNAAFLFSGCQKEKKDHNPWLLLLLLSSSSQESTTTDDLLTPAYYSSGSSGSFRTEVDTFLAAVRKVKLQKPLDVAYTIPSEGTFAANKGAEYHHSIDMHPSDGSTTLDIRAAHGGTLTVCPTKGLPGGTVYRHFLTVATDVKNDSGVVIGKLVSIYGHLDLDLDGGMPASGSTVARGEVISRHLYSETVGGPHLHFELRYYRPTDDVTNTCVRDGTSTGIPEYYGSYKTGDLTTASGGSWSLGYWNPDTGYGFGNPINHGLEL